MNTSNVVLCILFCAFSMRVEAETKDVVFQSVELVDYFDQGELGPPALAGLEEMVGRVPDEVATAVAGRNAHDRPHRLMLKVMFESSTLRSAFHGKRNSRMIVEAYLCGRRQDYAVIAIQTIYWRGRAIRSYTGAHADTDGSEKRSEHPFYFFANVQRRANPGAKLPEVAFDFTQKAEDVCFYLSDGNRTWFGFRSNEARVPKEAIEKAIRGGPQLPSPTGTDDSAGLVRGDAESR